MPKAPQPDTVNWPPIPARVQGLAGRIKVRQPWRVEPENAEVVGYYHSRDRLIDVDRRLPRNVKWTILAHEMTHAALDDAGLDLDIVLEERICDAVASAFATALEHYRLFGEAPK